MGSWKVWLWSNDGDRIDGIRNRDSSNAIPHFLLIKKIKFHSKLFERIFHASEPA